MSNSIIPSGSAERCEFFQNWNLEFPGQAAGLGFAPAVTDDITNQAAWAVLACTGTDDAESFWHAWVSWRDRLLTGDGNAMVGALPAFTMPGIPAGAMPLAGLLGRFTATITQVKAAPGYTPAIGDLLRINPAPVPPPDPATAQPKLTLTPEPLSVIRLLWKRGDFDAIRLRGQRAGDADWTDLGLHVKPPYRDARPPLAAGRPEVRTYQAMYELNGQPVGRWSDSVSATTQP